MSRLAFRSAGEYRAFVSETIKGASYFAWSLIDGQEANFRFSDAARKRYIAAVAELSLLAERANVIPAAGEAERDAKFRQFMSTALGSRYGRKKN